MSSSDGAIAWSWRWARRLDAVRSWALHNGPTDSDFGTDLRCLHHQELPRQEERATTNRLPDRTPRGGEMASDFERQRADLEVHSVVISFDPR